MRKPKSTTTRKKLGGSKNRSEAFIYVNCFEYFHNYAVFILFAC